MLFCSLYPRGMERRSPRRNTEVIDRCYNFPPRLLVDEWLRKQNFESKIRDWIAKHDERR